jgi:adenylate cyclase
MEMVRVERRLAAIMVADVVGYSSLMERDEAGTVARLTTLRDELINPLLAQHCGRLVKLMGDGALCEFASVVDAVACAGAIQKGIVERESGIHEEQPIRLRIGINLGDVIVQDGDLYGEGVNVAARLEQLADPGGVLISGTAYQHVKGKVPEQFAAMGLQAVKNISEPVAAWRMVLGDNAAPKRSVRLVKQRWPMMAGAALAVLLIGALGATVLWKPWSDSAEAKIATGDILALPTGPTVGVLPFTNLSNDPTQELFADGVTEEIVADLTRFRELRVLARNAMYRYKGQAVDPQQLGRELGLDYILQGSVRRSPDALRVSAQLIDGRDASQIWAETYDRPLTATAVMALEEEVAARIVSAVASPSGGAIVSSQLNATLGKPPERLSSYECVITAVAWYDREPSLYPKVRTCLRETVEADPEYSDAWALLADVYAKQWYGHQEPYPGERYDPLGRCLEAARRAVFLAPDSARAHYSLAKAYLMAGDLDAFYAEAQQALRLNPNEPGHLGSLGNWIAFTGRWEDGLALIDKAAKINPQSFAPWWYYAPAIDHFRKGEYEEAIKLFRRSFTGWWVNYMHQTYTYGMLGDEVRAQEAITKLREQVPGFSVASAIEFHRKYQFEPSVIEQVVKGLRRAGLPEA